eukprot:TRINITY_DN3857_c0_g1_i2.p1 TRINITY_DN3857_c0_g1~~TRINITY_DN3857_c0_g1_i2.p1  ORF type:complete len:685 (+),score=143.53 TRINITY_DN3857_c0_g1_i2:147-2201(+)
MAFPFMSPGSGLPSGVRTQGRAQDDVAELEPLFSWFRQVEEDSLAAHILPRSRGLQEPEQVFQRQFFELSAAAKARLYKLEEKLMEAARSKTSDFERMQNNLLSCSGRVQAAEEQIAAMRRELLSAMPVARDMLHLKDSVMSNVLRSKAMEKQLCNLQEELSQLKRTVQEISKRSETVSPVTRSELDCSMAVVERRIELLLREALPNTLLEMPDLIRLREEMEAMLEKRLGGLKSNLPDMSRLEHKFAESSALVHKLGKAPQTAEHSIKALRQELLLDVGQHVHDLQFLRDRMTTMSDVVEKQAALFKEEMLSCAISEASTASTAAVGKLRDEVEAMIEKRFETAALFKEEMLSCAISEASTASTAAVGKLRDEVEAMIEKRFETAALFKEEMLSCAISEASTASTAAVGKLRDEVEALIEKRFETENECFAKPHSITQLFARIDELQTSIEQVSARHHAGTNDCGGDDSSRCEKGGGAEYSRGFFLGKSTHDDNDDGFGLGVKLDLEPLHAHIARLHDDTVGTMEKRIETRVDGLLCGGFSDKLAKLREQLLEAILPDKLAKVPEEFMEAIMARLSAIDKRIEGLNQQILQAAPKSDNSKMVEIKNVFEARYLSSGAVWQPVPTSPLGTSGSRPGRRILTPAAVQPECGQMPLPPSERHWCADSSQADQLRTQSGRLQNNSAS